MENHLHVMAKDNLTATPAQIPQRVPTLVLDSARHLEFECTRAMATMKEPPRSDQTDVLQHASTRRLLWRMVPGLKGLMLSATEWQAMADATVNMRSLNPVPKNIQVTLHMSMHNQVCPLSTLTLTLYSVPFSFNETLYPTPCTRYHIPDSPFPTPVP